MSRNHTTLVIAHRLSTVVEADEIIVLEAGISSSVGHEALLAANGRYAAMWQTQYSEEQDRADEGVYPSGCAALSRRAT